MRKYIVLCALAGCFLSGCNESKFLKETPEDFMSTSNAFQTETDFDMSINGLYDITRWEFYGYDESKPFDYIYGTDLIYDGEPGTTNRHGNMLAAYDPTASIPKIHWDNLYKLIAEANTVLDRIEVLIFQKMSRPSLRQRPVSSAVWHTALWLIFTGVFLWNSMK